MCVIMLVFILSILFTPNAECMSDCLCVHACNGSNVYVFLFSQANAQRCSWLCSAAKLAWEVSEHFPHTNRGKSITSRLGEPLSIWRWADSAVPAAEGREREGSGDGNDCFTSGKMHGGVENPLWTPRYTPSQSSSGGAEWRGEESTCTHAWLVNTIGCSLLSCECNRALLVSLFLTHTLCQSTPIQQPGKQWFSFCQVNHSSTVARWSQRPQENSYLYLFFSLFILSGLSSYHCTD